MRTSHPLYLWRSSILNNITLYPVGHRSERVVEQREGVDGELWSTDGYGLLWGMECCWFGGEGVRERREAWAAGG